MVTFLLKVILFPFTFCYLCSDNKYLIDMDLESMKDHINSKKSGVSFLVTLLFFNRYFRNIFYMRIGKVSIILKRLLPGDKTFFPCSKMGGGIYAAHPYATILNAKSIGDYFSFRQCTTVGNKRDGEGFNGPTIGNHVTLGANVCIIGDIKIGDNVIVGAGSVVIKDVPSNSVVAGNPAKIIKRIYPSDV